MTRLAFAIGIMALGFAASTPARADFSRRVTPIAPTLADSIRGL